MKSNMQMVWTLAITAALSVWLTGCGGSSEQKPAAPPPTSGHGDEHAGGEHAGEKHAGGEHAEGIHELDELREEIEHLIKDDKLSDVHPPAQHISLIAKRLFELARKSGVPEESWRDINTQSRELAGLFDEVDEAADAGKKPETEAAVGKMFKLIDSLTAFAPKTEKESEKKE